MSKRKKKKEKYAVVFDFDGTATNVKDALVKLVDQRAVPKQALKELDALREKYFTPTMAGGLGPDQQAQWLTGTFDVYIRHGLKMPEAYRAIDHVDLRHGFRRCLAMLREEGVPVAIVSYGVRQFIRRVLAQQGLIEDTFDAVCAAELIVDPITRTILGYRPETMVIPANKGDWSRRFADAHGVPHDRILAVGDTRGDATLGHLRENRLGIAADAKEAEAIEEAFGEVLVTRDFGDVTDRLFEKMGRTRR